MRMVGVWAVNGRDYRVRYERRCKIFFFTCQWYYLHVVTNI